jgi:hypothetical protein
MKFRINKYWKKFVMYILLLICLEFLIDGQSEAFVHDVVLTVVVGSFFVLVTNKINK